MKSFKKVSLFLIVLSLLAVVLTAGMLLSAEAEPQLSIYAANLSFEDSVYIMYAVDAESLPAGQVKMLFWTAPILEGNADAYVKGTESYSASAYGETTIKGKTYKTFKYNKLRAKNMTDVIYARAYVEVDGVCYYSKLSKYSILQYAYNKLGYTGTASNDADLKAMLTDMLIYGASAQDYFGHNVDRLATASFYKVTLKDGVLADGSSSGLYLQGEELSISAPATNAEGASFQAWLDDKGGLLSATTDATITVGAANATYTAEYLAYSQGLAYTNGKDGTCYVSGLGSCTDTEIIIPAVHEGKEVIGIYANAFYAKRNIASVSIPGTVTSIGKNAFSYCSGLTSVYVPDSVTSIAESAFSDCTALVSVRLPEGLATINPWTFAGCTALSDITIPSTAKGIGNYAFKGCSSLTVLRGATGVTGIGEYAFSGAGLTSIVIPDSVVSIGQNAFNCSNATSLTIGSGLTTVKYNSFASCSALESITVSPANTTFYSVNDCMVKAASKTLVLGCKNSVIPTDGSVTAIGDSAFEGATGLTAINIPATVTSIGKGAFRRTGLISLEIPTGVTTISDETFNSCYSLASVTIPSTVTSIGKYAFSFCRSLTEIVIPSGVKTIGDYAFNYCEKLEKVSLSEGLATIGNAAFTSCESLTAISIPESVTAIGDTAFGYCSKLTSFTVPDGVTAVSPGLFAGCYKLQYVVIPDSVKTIGKNVFAYGVNKLSAIYYGGTEAEWGEIAIDTTGDATSNTVLETVTVYFYSASHPTAEGNYWRYAENAVEQWHASYVPVIDAAVPPTCTEDGLTEGVHCGTCGTVIVEQEAAEATGHNYVGGVCTGCGDVYSSDDTGDGGNLDGGFGSLG